VAHGQKHQEILYQSRRTLTLKKYSRHHTFFHKHMNCNSGTDETVHYMIPID
jgi:hypothetical protein